jgi:hypothetical protein
MLNIRDEELEKNWSNVNSLGRIGSSWLIGTAM